MARRGGSGFDWTVPGRVARAVALRDGGKLHWHSVAKLLSEEWGVEVREGQVRNACKWHGRFAGGVGSEPVHTTTAGPVPPAPPPEALFEEAATPAASTPPILELEAGTTGVAKQEGYPSSHNTDPSSAPTVSAAATKGKEPLLVEEEDILDVRVIAPPPASLPLDELIEHRKRRFTQRKAHETARSLIPVILKDDGPIGILHFGDPHVDDDGCDLAMLEEHCRIVRETPGMYAATVGDLTNNWIGRLSALYGQQATTESEGWAIAERFISKWIGPKWLYLVGGNHDSWSGAGDPLNWICRQSGALYQTDEARVELRFPGGHRIRINCRHDFPGRSIYNEAHGALRWLIFNQRDHVAIAGHTHVSSHHELKAPESGINMHAIRVAAYKVIDSYARTAGLADKHLSPCVVTVINTRLDATDPDLIRTFWNPAEGARYLTLLRAECPAPSTAVAL